MKRTQPREFAFQKVQTVQSVQTNGINHINDIYGEIAAYYDIIYGADIDYNAESLCLHDIFKKYKVKTLLDISCGTATHLIHLGKQGYSGNGFDISEKMLEIANEKAIKESLDLNLQIADMKSLQTHNQFDAVFSLYALGLNSTPNDVECILRNIYPLVKNKGIFVFNVMNADCDYGDMSSPGTVTFDAESIENVKAAWIYHTTIEGNIQHLDAVYIIEDKGNVSMFVHNHRIVSFQLAEIKRITEAAGFQIAAVYGSTTGLVEFTGQEPAMMVVSRKL